MKNLKTLRELKSVKTILALFIFLAAMISLTPVMNVQADTTDFNIISTTNVTAEQAKSWAKSKGASDTFVSIADLYFKYYGSCGNVNPAIAYVQSAKETGFGKFGGVINESYCNPCGLKTEQGGDNSDPNAHMKFNSWDEGVQAHMDHLALYAGADGYPKSGTYDPRHFISIKGAAPTVNALGGKWAPSATYGEEISGLYQDLMSFSGVSSDSTKPSGDVQNPGNQSSGDVQAPDNSESNKPDAAAVDEENYNNQVNISSPIGWVSINGVWYYYKSDNSMAKGWINPDGNWYYLYDNGHMAVGWLYVDSTWYYLQTSGAMATGWVYADGNWYYMQPSGAMITGWIQSKGDYYYLQPLSGRMEKNVVIDGYSIGSDGKLGSSNTSSSDRAKVIVIDPGHNYGGDYGASSELNGVKYIETDLNMQVAVKLKNSLESKGYSVIMTRDESDKSTADLNTSLSSRSNITNAVDASFFISIHHNSAGESAKGIETFYSVHPRDAAYGGVMDDSKVAESRRMAQIITNKIADKIGAVNRGAKDDSQRSLFVLRNSDVPAVLVEVGFITNPDEAARCADPASQQMVADAIADAVAENY